MRITIPKVHGKTPKEKLLRSLALVLVFAAVIWAFMKNNERVVDMLNQQSSVYDETKTLDTAQKKFIISFVKAMRDEYGMECTVKIFGGDFVVPELDAKTIYIGLAPSIGVAKLRFPPMMRQALGAGFIETLKTDHLQPSFENGDWPQEIQIVLATIYNKLTEINEGDASSE